MGRLPGCFNVHDLLTDSRPPAVREDRHQPDLLHLPSDADHGHANLQVVELISAILPSTADHGHDSPSSGRPDLGQTPGAGHASPLSGQLALHLGALVSRTARLPEFLP